MKTFKHERKLYFMPEKKREFKIDKKTSGLLAIIFGIVIFLKPDILALLVALYLIVYGILTFFEK